MESENKQLLSTKKESFYLTKGSNFKVFLETKDAEVKITVSNNGPASEIIFYLTDMKGKKGNVFTIKAGIKYTFKLGEAGQGDILLFQTNEEQGAEVTVSW